MSKKTKSENKDYKSLDTLIDNTFDKIKNLVDTNTVVGNAISIAPGKIIVPISKVSVGIISGGGELPTSKKNNLSVSACSTTGFTITPIGFITVSDGAIDFVAALSGDNVAGRYVELFAGICDKFLSKKEFDSNEE